MRARASLVAEADEGGVTRLIGVRSDPPLLLRATAGAVYLVGGAGGPVGGDDLSFDVVVGPAATLTVRTAAASVALPGGGPSMVRVTASVGAGGHLEFLPEPVVAARGCRHHLDTSLTLATGARVLWREEIVLGRHGETSGSVEARFAVDAGPTPLLRQELMLGPGHPGYRSPAVVGWARAIGSVLIVDPSWETGGPPAATLGPTGALLPLAGPGVLVTAVDGDPLGLRRRLDSGVDAVRAAPPPR